VEIQVQQILLQVLNFAILLFALSKFLYKPILKILDERANKINEGLQAAEKSLAEQARLEERKQEEMVIVQKQVAKILEEAKVKADKMGKELLEEAREEAGKVIRKEEAALKARLEAEERKLKGQIADLVAVTTKAVLKDALTSKQQQEIIKSQMAQLKKLKVN
jgi:F-type H+-transporting ATPase subunit b